MAHIYRLLNVVTEQFYIGSAVKYKRRRWEHFNDLKRGAHHCKQLQAAWDTYGPEAFEFELLEEIEDVVALQVEDTYLAQYAGQNCCYNTALSSMQPPSADLLTREKIRTTMLRLYADKTKHPRYGKQHTEETKAKISASKRANPTRYWEGKERSEETKAKISEAQKGVARPRRTYTPEGLKKVRETMRKNAREQVPLSFDAVLAKFPEEVQGGYDFSAAVYTGALERIQGVVCPTHGVFSQYAAQFRKGRGCPECGAAQRAASKKKQMLEAWADPAQRTAFMAARIKSLASPE
jgi:group I intron endonuclease